MTVQAKRLVDALKAIGLKHGSFRTGGEFTVSTDTKRITSRDGFRYSEFGDAMASVATVGQEKVLANLDRLVTEFGLSVTVVESSATGFRHAIVSSRHNPDRIVTYSTDGAWRYEKVTERK
jgi:hypothetical protein